MTTNYIREHVLIGHTAERERVYVDVKLTEHDGEHVTTDHGTVTGIRRLSIMGEVIESGRREPHSCGQIRGELDRITECAAGWNVGMVRRLGELWDTWHLNDLQAACDHQTVVYEDSSYGRRPSLTETRACPVSGYRYGSAWLVKPLPADVEKEIRAIFGDDPPADPPPPPAPSTTLGGVPRTPYRYGVR
jgi:hypothetical protein